MEIEVSSSRSACHVCIWFYLISKSTAKANCLCPALSVKPTWDATQHFRASVATPQHLAVPGFFLTHNFGETYGEALKAQYHVQLFKMGDTTKAIGNEGHRELSLTAQTALPPPQGKDNNDIHYRGHAIQDT